MSLKFEIFVIYNHYYVKYQNNRLLLNVDQIILKIVKLIFLIKTITLIIIYSNINKDYSNHNA